MVSFIWRPFLASLLFILVFLVSLIIFHEYHDNLLSLILRSAVFGLSSLSSFSTPLLGSDSWLLVSFFRIYLMAVFLIGALSRTVESWVVLVLLMRMGKCIWASLTCSLWIIASVHSLFKFWVYLWSQTHTQLIKSQWKVHTQGIFLGYTS